MNQYERDAREDCQRLGSELVGLLGLLRVCKTFESYPHSWARLRTDLEELVSLLECARRDAGKATST